MMLCEHTFLVWKLVSGIIEQSISETCKLKFYTISNFEVKMWLWNLDITLRSVYSFFFSPCFLGLHLWHMEVPRLGSNWSCSCRPTPLLQQHQIWAKSVTYTTAHGKAGSLTHWVRPEIKPVSSWLLVRFISAEPRWELWSMYSWL